MVSRLLFVSLARCPLIQDWKSFRPGESFRGGMFEAGRGRLTRDESTRMLIKPTRDLGYPGRREVFGVGSTMFLGVVIGVGSR